VALISNVDKNMDEALGKGMCNPKSAHLYYTITEILWYRYFWYHHL